MSYDQILTYIGEFGLYQKRSLLLLSAIAIQIGIHGTSIVFQNLNPRFRCAVPGLENDSFQIQDLNHERLVKAHIPFDESVGGFSECRSYLSFSLMNLTDGNKTTECERWVYDKSTGLDDTMATELNLVCERSVYKAHITMVMMMGILVGSLFGGTVADLFGRKRVAILSALFQSMCSVFLAFAFSVPLIICLRFLMSFAATTTFLAIFVLVAEIVGPSRRNIATMSVMFGWCVGLFVLLAVQFFIRDWRTAQLVQTTPFFVFVLYFWSLEESPRWLLIREKVTQAEAVIKLMAQVNKTQLPREMEQDSFLAFDNQGINGDSYKVEEKPKYSKFWHMCSRPVLVIRLIILAFCWSTLSMVYYGLVLGVGDLIEGNIYINFGLQSAMELFSNMVCLYTLGKVGRKKIFCTSMSIAGLACLSISCTIFTKIEIHWLVAILFSIGKFGITQAFSIVYIVTAELLPTSMRNSGIGFCSFVGRIAAVISPYIATASLRIPGPFGKAFPVLLFGIFSSLSGIFSLLLPETKNRKLPETINDACSFSRRIDDKDLNLNKPKDKSIKE